MAPTGKSVCLLGLILGLTLTTVTPEAATSTPALRKDCVNGGTPTESCCLCPPYFSGCTCAVISNTITPASLNRTFRTTIEVKEPFKKEYEDTSSALYQNLSQTFIAEMTPIYEKVMNFKAVVSITFTNFTAASRRSVFSVTPEQRSSSVSATHDIIVESPNTEAGFNATLAEIKTALEAVKTCSSPTSDKEGCPSFEVGAVGPLNKVEFDLAAFCNATVGDLKDYFVYETENGVARCYSHCVRDKPCDNDGSCQVSTEGTTCYCQYTDQYWYLHSNCAFKVHKIGFYSGVTVSAILLVVIIAVLTAYIILTSRKKALKKDVKEALVAAWMEDDFTLPSRTQTPSSGVTDNHGEHTGSSGLQQNQGPGGFASVPAYSQNRAGVGRDLPGRQEGPSFRNHPQHYPESSAPASSQSARTNMPNAEPMWNRPQLRSSVDSFDI